MAKSEQEMQKTLGIPQNSTTGRLLAALDLATLNPTQRNLIQNNNTAQADSNEESLFGVNQLRKPSADLAYIPQAQLTHTINRPTHSVRPVPGTQAAVVQVKDSELRSLQEKSNIIQDAAENDVNSRLTAMPRPIPGAVLRPEDRKAQEFNSSYTAAEDVLKFSSMFNQKPGMNKAPTPTPGSPMNEQVRQSQLANPFQTPILSH